MDWRALVLVLVTVVLWGSYGVILKAISRHMHPMVSMMWFVAGYMVCVGAYLIIAMGKSWGRAFQPSWVWALVAGAMGGLGAITFFRALPLGKGSAIIPLVGLYTAVTAVGCILFLKEGITPRLLIGLACAAAAVVMLGGEASRP